MASKWISYDDLIARWGIVDFELLDYLKQGLPIYGSFLQRMYEVRPGESGYDYSLREEPYRIEFPFMNFEMPEDTQMALRKLSNLRTCLFKREEVFNFGREHGLGPQDPQVHSTPETDQASPEPPIRHSDDFRKVVKEGKEYILTPKQAQVIEILYNNFMKGTPEVGQDFIRESIYGHNVIITTRVRDIFKSSPDARKALIEQGPRKGIFRLKA